MQAYVHNYNVYMIPDLAATSPVIMEVSPTNGQKNLIYYGIPSWMYEGNWVIFLEFQIAFAVLSQT